jgi:RadC-like JAB domain
MREMTCEQSRQHALVSTLRECDPSPEDTKVTKLLFEAGQILGITFLDRLIFTTHSFFSFKENRVQNMREKVTRGEVKP